MKRILTLLLLAVVLQLVNVSHAASQSKSDKIDEYLSLNEEYDMFNGSALVATGGEVIYKGGHGWANMEWKIQNSANTKHRLGSITKQFTSMLIMQLVEEGKVDLQVPITKYLPDYPKGNGDKITIHHLLTHTSGLPNYTSFPSFFNEDSRNPYTPEEFVGYFADSTLNFQPGEKFEYSNSGYFLLGYIIEEITENTYEDELRARIFDPLEMNDTGYDHHADILENRAAGYERQGMDYINAPYINMSLPYAAGSMYSTVEDLYKWDQALYGDKLVKAESRAMMFDKHVEAFGMHYGYGWMISENTEGQEVVMHGGGINGFNTIIVRVPETKDLVVLLNNTGGTDLEDMAKSLTAIVHDKPYDKPKMSAGREVYGVVKASGIEKGLERFKEIADDDGFEVSEREFNAMGYDLLQNGMKKEALAILKLNVELYPESWNTHDSYGEALMAMDRKDEAISSYKKSVEMNPGNTSGIEKLKELGVDIDNLVKDVVVEDAILASYVGKYELQPGFILSITKEGSQLSGQATGQGANPIFPKSENEFYLKVVAAELVFHKNDAGEVDSLTLKQDGQEMKAKKIE